MIAFALGVIVGLSIGWISMFVLLLFLPDRHIDFDVDERRAK